MRYYIEDWENIHIKKKNLRYSTHFLEIYGGISLYGIDPNKRYTIDHGEIRLVRKYGYALIGKPDHPDGN